MIDHGWGTQGDHLQHVVLRWVKNWILSATILNGTLRVETLILEFLKIQYLLQNTLFILSIWTYKPWQTAQTQIRCDIMWHPIRFYSLCHLLSNADTSKGMLNVLKFQTLCSILFWSKFCFLCSSIHSAMANSVDPDQTQKQSDLGLHCLHMSFCQTLWCTKF